MKRKLIYVAAMLLLCCLAVTKASAQSGKQLTRVTIPGYLAFAITDDALIPIGTTGGLVTITKAADNLDQRFHKAMKDKTAFATLDLVVYNNNGGQLTKSKTFHFTKLVVKSVVPNVNKLSAVGLSFDHMTQQ